MHYQFRTWHAETAVAVLVIVGTTLATATRAVDWLACAAVIASFRHGQVSERMAEAQAHLPKPSVPCFRVAEKYWILKELTWFSFFVLQGSYAAVGGCVLFAAYPFWRRYWRSVHPRVVEEPS